MHDSFHRFCSLQETGFTGADSALLQETGFTGADSVVLHETVFTGAWFTGGSLQGLAHRHDEHGEEVLERIGRGDSVQLFLHPLEAALGLFHLLGRLESFG
jgi:hypothetical protein